MTDPEERISPLYYVVIPAYRPDERLWRLTSEVLDTGCFPIVVDEAVHGGQKPYKSHQATAHQGHEEHTPHVGGYRPVGELLVDEGEDRAKQSQGYAYDHKAEHATAGGGKGLNSRCRQCRSPLFRGSRSSWCRDC